jgi:hypothetical protein
MAFSSSYINSQVEGIEMNSLMKKKYNTIFVIFYQLVSMSEIHVSLISNLVLALSLALVLDNCDFDHV